MRKILLAGVGIIISTGTAYAACIPTPDCASLGYESSSSCEGGIKCPFGNAWNCTLVNKITEIEKIIQEGGTSSDNKNCQIGNIYYSDKSCSVSLDSSKTPIGVVVYVDGQGHGQVMALKSIGSYKWGKYDGDNTDIPTLTNYEDSESASYDLNSCANTQKIIAAGKKEYYPAANAAHEYKTAGTNAGDWCLPAAGVFTSIYNNKSVVNIGMTNAGGSQIGTSSEHWSSSERDRFIAWHLDLNNNYGMNHLTSSNSNYSKAHESEVRPILEF